jgi:hypothetical protein
MLFSQFRQFSDLSTPGRLSMLFGLQCRQAAPQTLARRWKTVWVVSTSPDAPFKPNTPNLVVDVVART